ncbi:MAG: P-loop NTPase [Bdellovibrionales bacterium]
MSELNEYRKYGPLRGQAQPGSKLIAIGGGKGGVGKSFVSSGIAMFLANMGHKTVLVDLDLGAANLHTYLGMGMPDKTLQTIIDDGSYDIDKILSSTHLRNLKLVAGSNDSLDIADINTQQRSQLIRSLFYYPADFIILDLSAGTHNTTLDFFNMAQKHIIVTTPEPISIENAYRFMKAAFFQVLKRYEKQLDLESTIMDLMSRKNELDLRCPADLLHIINQVEPEKGPALTHILSRYKFDIILNQSRTFRDSSMGHSIQSVAKKYFGVPAEYLGTVDHDNAVWQSLRNNKHLLIESPIPEFMLNYLVSAEIYQTLNL